jgi:hypothetical protein
VGHVLAGRPAQLVLEGVLVDDDVDQRFGRAGGAVGLGVGATLLG